LSINVVSRAVSSSGVRVGVGGRVGCGVMGLDATVGATVAVLATTAVGVTAIVAVATASGRAAPFKGGLASLAPQATSMARTRRLEQTNLAKVASR
jgi:hypothetical protein